MICFVQEWLPYQKRSLVRKRNQEVSRAAGNETVLGGDEEKGLIDGSCFPGYDNDENSKRSSDPLRDNVTVLPGSSCVVGGAENIFEAKDPFPFKPSNTSCGWSRQPQLPGLGKDENEKGQPALPTSPQGAADKDIKQGTVEQPDQQQGEQDMTGDKEELSRVEEESQEEPCLSNDEAISDQPEEHADKSSKEKEQPNHTAIGQKDQDQINDDFERGTLIDNEVLGKPRTASATKIDPHHAFPDLVDNFVGDAHKFSIPTKGVGGQIVRHSELYQIEGSLNGRSGIFEWIIDQGKVTHRRFIPNGKIAGYSNQVPQKD